MEELLIGTDVGTTGTKSMVMDTHGNILETAYKSYPTYNSRPGYSEQDAEDWWNAVVATVRECTQKEEIRRSVVAMSLSSQGGSMVPVGKDGLPLRKAIVWIDKRGTEQCDYLRHKTAEEYFYLTTGWELTPGMNAVQILWMRQNEPELFGKTAKFLSTIDFINGRLTGESTIDPSNAGISQLIDLKTREWDPLILDLVGITENRLPKIEESGNAIGTLSEKASEELGLPGGVKVVSGGHDQYCAALGAGAVETGNVFLATGTAWVALKVSDKPAFDIRTHLAQSIHTVKGKWGSLGSLENGGSSLRWFRDNFGKSDVKNGKVEVESYKQIDSVVAGRPAGSRGVMFFPYFNGSSIPDNDPRCKATIVGLDFCNDRYDVARAVMESVVFQTKRVLELFGPLETGITALKLLGGATRSPVWSQMVADILGKPVRAPKVADIACVGAAILAGHGAGLFPDMGEGYRQMRQEETEYTPDGGNKEKYREIYEVFKMRAAFLSECYRIGQS